MFPECTSFNGEFENDWYFNCNDTELSTDKSLWNVKEHEEGVFGTASPVLQTGNQKWFIEHQGTVWIIKTS